MTYRFQRITLEHQKKLRLVEIKNSAAKLGDATECDDAFHLFAFCQSYANNFLHGELSIDVLTNAIGACESLIAAAMQAEIANYNRLNS